MAQDRKTILQMLSEGKISVEEAESQLAELDEKREFGRIAADIGAGVRDAFKSAAEEMVRAFSQGWDEIRQGFDEFGGHIGLATPDTADLRDAGEEQFEFAVAAGQALEVRNAFGNVSVSEVEGETLRITTHRWAVGASDDEARETARQVEVRAEEEEGTVKVRVRGEDRRLMRRVRVHLEITALAGVNVDVKGIAGKIACRNLSGEMAAKTVSGEIALQSLRGKASAHAVSGMVTAEGLGAGIQASTVSGQIQVRDCQGPARLNTVSGLIAASGRGEVSAHSVSGLIRLVGIESDRVTAKSVSGPVEIEFSAPFSGSLAAQTVSGPVEVRLPRESDCKVEVGGGHTDLDPGLAMTGVQVRQRHLSGVLGSGAGAVEIKTISGAVRLAATG